MKKARFEQRCPSVKQRAENCVWRSPVPGALLSQPTVLELRFRVPGDRESLGLQPEIHGVWKGSRLVPWREMLSDRGQFSRQIPGEHFWDQILQRWWTQVTEMPWSERWLGAKSGGCHPSTVGSVQGPPGKAPKGATGRGKMWLVDSQLGSMERARGGGGSCIRAAWLCMCLYVCLPVCEGVCTCAYLTREGAQCVFSYCQFIKFLHHHFSCKAENENMQTVLHFQ